MDAKSPAAERILQALQSLYIKVTIEFMEFVFGDLTLSNQNPSSSTVYFLSFLKTTVKDLMAVDVDKEMDWQPLSEVYSGIMANETLKEMRPHEKKSGNL
eukprot:gene5682-10924_t